MTDEDYLELRARLLAIQVVLSAVVAAHPDKDRLSAYVAEGLDQMKAMLLYSRLDAVSIEQFDATIQAIVTKAGLELGAG